MSQFQRRVDDDSPSVDATSRTATASGASARPDEIEARMTVHRAAFAPSKMTVEKYARLTTLPHYRFEDDLVVEAPDGSLAAFAMAWWDPIARVGEYEPVGTHPDHQRRGPRARAPDARAASLPRPGAGLVAGLFERRQRRLRGPVPGRRLRAPPLRPAVRTPADPDLQSEP